MSRNRHSYRARQKRLAEARAGKYGELNRLTAEGIVSLYQKLQFCSELENASEGPVRIRIPISYTVLSYKE